MHPDPGVSNVVILVQVAAFLIGRNRSALLGRSMDEHEMQELIHLLKSDPVGSLVVLG